MKKKKYIKPYYRKKGKYADGRARLVIEYIKGGRICSQALPKPERMLYLLSLVHGQAKKSSHSIRKNGQVKI